MGVKQSDTPLLVGSIGAGNMARALMGGIARAGMARPEDCLACDIKPEARAAFEKATGIKAIESGAEVLRRCEVILLAVKPQTMGDALDAIRAGVEARHLFISIAAGIKSGFIEKRLGAGAEGGARGGVRVVRVMPNTPALLGAGAAGVAPGAYASAEDVALTIRLMNAVGIAVAVDESQMDAVTALSGSGPAYFFYFVERLIAAGIEQGLAPDVSARLAKQTILGAARMLCERPETPEQLRAAVTSPGGTTAAAIKAFDEGGFGPLIARAVEAAVARGRELGAERRGNTDCPQ
ncbi:MAG: pyrroline-5-carboxylate reductase [Candidatus Sumerlaeota bacterium]|nr:pyrroline-5-carboxylate reductase [Candidatus Sumerlaeota bacterium]